MGRNDGGRNREDGKGRRKIGRRNTITRGGRGAKKGEKKGV